MGGRESDLERFYSILSHLEISGYRQGLPLSSYTARSGLPVRGVYFFREAGEFRKAGRSPRIVRVGTHAVSTGSKSTLWNRLKAHLGTAAGTGNHRGSIFRHHVGAALLARDHQQLTSWGVGSSVPLHVKQNRQALAAEAAWEKRVSDYIGKMTILWLDVPDPPGAASLRASIEKNAIGLLSNQLDPPDAPSVAWLGRQSPRQEIRASGLWNLQHVNAIYSPEFLDHLETAVELTVKAAREGGARHAGHLKTEARPT